MTFVRQQSRLRSQPASVSGAIAVNGQAVGAGSLVAAAAQVFGSVTTQQPSEDPFRQYVLFDGPSGVTGLGWNNKVRVYWRNQKLGDWLDADQIADGSTPYATLTVSSGDTGWKTLDATDLTDRWLSTGENRGAFLRSVSSGWVASFAGRTNSISTHRPYLHVVTSDGAFNCPVTATARTDTSSSLWLDGRESMAISQGSSQALMQFDLSGVTGTLASATMYLWLIEQQGVAQTNRIQLFELDPPTIRLGGWTGPIVTGLAAGYSNDVGIDAHPNVLFAPDFADTNSEKNYVDGGIWDRGNAGPAQILSKVVEPEGTTSLRSGFLGPEYGSGDRLWGGDLGRTMASSATIATSKPGQVYNELYFRYYVIFEDDWGDTTSGYKMPGISGTWGYIVPAAGHRLGGYYQNISGNGAGPVSGLYEDIGDYYALNGWTMRGFGDSDQGGGNPYDDRFYAVGNYYYDMDKQQINGEMWWWGTHLEKNRWYCIEQRCKMNSIDLSSPDALGNGTANFDGIYQVWIDGHLVAERSNWRWTRHPDFGVMGPWLDWYHGGTIDVSQPEQTQHYRMKNIVCATSYIGPKTTVLPSWVPAPGESANISSLIAQSFDSQVSALYNAFFSQSIIGLSRGGSFSGGVANPYIGANGGILCHGGGHSATNDNSIFLFDLNDLKWKRLTDPTDFGRGPWDGGGAPGNDNHWVVGEDFTLATAEAIDGQPGSIHSYDLLEVLPPSEGGGTYGSLFTVVRQSVGYGSSPTGCRIAHEYPIDSLTTRGTIARHSSGSDATSSYENPSCATVYDPTRNRFWYVENPTTAGGKIGYYDHLTQTYGYVTIAANKPMVAGGVDSSYLRYDAVHDALIWTGSNGSATYIAYCLLTSIASGWVVPTLSATIPAGGGAHVALDYVADIGKWVAITTGSLSNVYEITIPADISGTWTVSARAIGGDGDLPGWYMTGKTWGYLQSIKCFVMIGGKDTIYVYRPYGT